MDDLSQRLYDFVYSRNATRSSQISADGFVAGRRVATLQADRKRAERALMALADWVEDKARDDLGLPATPVGKS